MAARFDDPSHGPSFEPSFEPQDKPEPPALSSAADASQPKQRRSFGIRQEALVADYLSAQGLKLLSQNFQCRTGEIDLIMLDGETLVFIEVRYRRSSRYGGAAASVDHRKQRKLISCARYYLLGRGLSDQVACRFDVVALAPQASSQGGLQIEWIRNAFGCPGG